MLEMKTLTKQAIVIFQENYAQHHHYSLPDLMFIGYLLMDLTTYCTCVVLYIYITTYVMYRFVVEIMVTVFFYINFHTNEQVEM